MYRLFLMIGIPVSAMCLTFLILCTFPPVIYRLPVVVSPVIALNGDMPIITKSKVGRPVRLRIDTINVDTTINPFGLTSSGAMDIAEDPDTVAWYQFGAIPGQEGNAVIAGHYGWKNSHGSIFNDLHLMQANNFIYVYDVNGAMSTFTVRRTKLYDPSADAGEVFTSSDNKVHLNLVTCEGTWVSSKDSYSNRFVVFADLKE